ncbi:MAG: hypothetical protein LAO05_16430 [Acidobacteriia bacterium]|nr:hypothetical protein [Terriglobia bacterium]
MSIEASAGAGSVSKLKLEVTQNVLRVRKVKVLFADGQNSSLDWDRYVGAGCSSVLDRPSAKEVQKVESTYFKPPMTDGTRPTLAKVFGSD